MKSRDFSASRTGRSKLLALAVAGALLLILSGVGVYGLLTGPGTAEPPAESGPVVTASSSPRATPMPGATPSLPTLAASTDPETFARRVATVLFTWDTASGLGPLGYTSVLLEVADPAGEEQAGLASDIATYLPSRDAWSQLREYATAQTLTIDDAYVPAAWDDALAHGRGRLADGTIAVTVEGTRHRTGVWYDKPVAADRAVAFTVFAVCEPSYGTCHLLRLSELDNPLR
ncbi:MAG TPA: hypothetical protein VN035_14315 [Microbacterium sp.]|nr:hypothetical protein [Microbacterium sp.]